MRSGTGGSVYGARGEMNGSRHGTQGGDGSNSMLRKEASGGKKDCGKEQDEAARGSHDITPPTTSTDARQTDTVANQ